LSLHRKRHATWSKTVQSFFMDFELPTFQSAPVRALFVYHVRFASPLAIWSKIVQNFSRV